MFKIIFFLFTIFIVYKVIQFFSKVYYLYTNAKKQYDQGRSNFSQQTYQRKEDGKTTIHYKENGKKAGHSSKQNQDEDYIDFEEVKE